jgi:hypothetical protein
MANKIKSVLILFLFPIIIMLTGCATLGPQFQKIEKIPDNSGVVYIYRPASYGPGFAVSYDINVGDNAIVYLANGCYYPYFTKAGEIEFWAETESKASVTLDVKAGQIYYIKGSVGMGFFVGRPHLIVVSSDVGENEILDCKYCPEKVEYKQEQSNKSFK